MIIWQTDCAPGDLPAVTTVMAPAKGLISVAIAASRPVRIWLDAQPILDEPLWWRHYQRAVRAIAMIGVTAGPHHVQLVYGDRPRHPSFIDALTPSRNRAGCLAGVDARWPDRITLTVHFQPDIQLPPVSLRWSPAQFHRDGLTWQEIQVRQFADIGSPPSSEGRNAGATMAEPLGVESSDWPGRREDATTPGELRAGLRRLYVPVGTIGAQPPRRTPGPDDRPEPYLDIVAEIGLRIEDPSGIATAAMPVFESLGRLAPRRVWSPPIAIATGDELLRRLPEPLLPPAWAHLRPLWRACWDQLTRLPRLAHPTSGLPGSYVGTAEHGFTNEIFVWDSCFAAYGYAHGWRAFPAITSLDCLYSRQQDGGYIHREHDVRDGLPVMYEPDFSPNPPLLAVVELHLARLSGDVGRLRQVLPALTAEFTWLKANRRLADGTYWTTGLASGLDNAPTQGGEGYPDLTAQMAQAADALAEICALVGEDSAPWRHEHVAIANACNASLWNEESGFYHVTLPGGGHNPAKIVTGFWPLWAGIVPAGRIPRLAAQLTDPRTFGRHHPLPSLAADAPAYRSDGDYWRGSVWAPTSCAAILGFQRAGCSELARSTALRHLTQIAEVLAATGSLWENYSPDRTAPGGLGGPGYSWTAGTPIALLIETILGIEADAPARRVRWSPPIGVDCGLDRLAVGAATMRLQQRADGVVAVETDRTMTLELVRGDDRRSHACTPGRTEIRW